MLLVACKAGDTVAAAKALSAGADPRIVGDSNSPDFNAALRLAARFGHAHLMQLFLADRRVDPNGHPADLQPALAVAAECGHLAVVEALLLRPDTDPSIKNNLALRLACAAGHLAVAERLLAHPRVDPAADDGSALCMALHRGHATVAIRLLDDERVDPNVHPDFLPPPIAMAVALDDPALIDKLLARGCDPRVDDFAAFRMAMQFDRMRVLERLLLCPEADELVTSKSWLDEALRQGSTSAFRLMLARGRFDPAADDNHALCEALRHGQVEIAELLLADPRVDPSAPFNWPIRLAAQLGRVRIVESMLAQPNVDPAAGGDEAIRTAAACGHDEVVARLLAHPRVNPAVGGNAALHAASTNGHATIVQLLLQHPLVALEHALASPLPPHILDTLLHRQAALGECAAVRRLLADARVNPAAANNIALRAAAASGHAEVVDALLCDGRADPSVVLPSTEPLMSAATNGHTAVVARLLADPRVDPEAGYNKALTQACLHGHVAVVDLLLAHPRVDPFKYGSSSVARACSDGQLAVLERLLAHPHMIWPVGAHAAAAAAENGHVAILELLLRAEGRVALSVGPGSALSKAAMNGHIDAVRILLRHSLVKPSAYCNDALMQAVKRGHYGVIDALLTDPRVRLVEACKRGDMVQVESLLSGCGLPPVDPAADDDAAVIAAAAAGHLPVVERLLTDPRVDCTARHFAALKLAAESGHTAVVKRLLAQPQVDACTEGSIAVALRAAVSGRHTGVVLAFVEDPRFGPAFDNDLIIRGASRWGGTAAAALVRFLLSVPDVDPAAQHNSAVRSAAEFGHAEVLELLLEDPRVDPAIHVYEGAMFDDFGDLFDLIESDIVRAVVRAHSSVYATMAGLPMHLRARLAQQPPSGTPLETSYGFSEGSAASVAVAAQSGAWRRRRYAVLSRAQASARFRGRHTASEHHPMVKALASSDYAA